eukprot:TRINITY_DN3378_c0_g3_i1.p1 TRINITY_DN3378_c0_g3~~TRINITY_DN3378_c0_g3_i1.p1  ORF type:complete len:127 (+),score=18.74 TRINITY_DN3378_c0_g3_i1:47-427(+)
MLCSRLTRHTTSIYKKTKSENTTFLTSLLQLWTQKRGLRKAKASGLISAAKKRFRVTKSGNIKCWPKGKGKPKIIRWTGEKACTVDNKKHLREVMHRGFRKNFRQQERKDKYLNTKSENPFLREDQ